MNNGHLFSHCRGHPDVTHRFRPIDLHQTIITMGCFYYYIYYYIITKQRRRCSVCTRFEKASFLSLDVPSGNGKRVTPPCWAPVALINPRVTRNEDRNRATVLFLITGMKRGPIRWQICLSCYGHPTFDSTFGRFSQFTRVLTETSCRIKIFINCKLHCLADTRTPFIWGLQWIFTNTTSSDITNSIVIHFENISKCIG